MAQSTPPKAPPPPRREGQPSYWLLKSEPAKYSWSDLVRDGRAVWDGVRNPQAAIYLKAMRVGDLAFIYHSNQGLAVVGVAEITREAYPDPSDPTGRAVALDIRPLEPLRRAVSLAEIKAEPTLAGMALLRLPRVSVTPVTPEAWARIVAMAGLP